MNSLHEEGNLYFIILFIIVFKVMIHQTELIKYVARTSIFSGFVKRLHVQIYLIVIRCNSYMFRPDYKRLLQDVSI